MRVQIPLPAPVVCSPNDKTSDFSSGNMDLSHIHATKHRCGEARVYSP